jgi:hypothetical protein
MEKNEGHVLDENHPKSEMILYSSHFVITFITECLVKTIEYCSVLGGYQKHKQTPVVIEVVI